MDRSTLHRPADHATHVVAAVVATLLAALVVGLAGPASGAGADTTGAAHLVARAGGSTVAHRVAQVRAARQMLAVIRIGGRGPHTGYDRTARFGAAWLDVNRNGCRTRDDILTRDLTDRTRTGRCAVVAGTLHDPYTGRTLQFRKAQAQRVQIDHLVALSLAWELGAAQWTPGKRIAFANDPANLLAVAGWVNAAKSDSAPDAWLPPAKSYRCTYAIRFTRVVYGYRLWLTRSMAATVTRLLDGCATVTGSPAGLRLFGPAVWADAGRFAGPAAPVGRDCPASAPIKGNDSSSGELIYHVPGGAYYAVTVPERCFATEADAVAAGYRRSKL